MIALVFMGVAGCGKSSVASGVARELGIALIEGDDFHPPENREKMHNGIALTDDDRKGWLDALGAQLAAHPEGVALTCSALKGAYRDLFRRMSPGVRFVFLDLDREAALERVAARGAAHFFSPKLVDSQFATLERPDGEPGVLRVDATEPVSRLVEQVVDWEGRCLQKTALPPGKAAARERGG